MGDGGRAGNKMGGPASALVFAPSLDFWVRFEAAATLLPGAHDAARLRALVALRDAELDLLAFHQLAIAASLDRGLVYEHVGPALALDETEPLLRVEPLDGAGKTFLCHVLDPLPASFGYGRSVPSGLETRRVF